MNLVWACFISLALATPKAEVKPAKGPSIVTVELEWEKIPEAKAYEIEIKSENFDQHFKSKTELFSVQIPLGEHQVRGRSQDHRGVFGEWSDFQTFSAVPQKVDLKTSSEKNPPKIKIENYSAWVQLKWIPIVGAKKYKFFLKDEKGTVLAVHESKVAQVAFKTRPGSYQYNVTAVYSGDIESEQSTFQPTVSINGRKLDPPELVSSLLEESLKKYRLKNDPHVVVKAKLEYSPYLGDTWTAVNESTAHADYSPNETKKPGRYRVLFRNTLAGYGDSDPVIREFAIKPQEADLEKMVSK